MKDMHALTPSLSGWRGENKIVMAVVQ